MHYCKEKPSCSAFRAIATILWGVRKFRKFTVMFLPMQQLIVMYFQASSNSAYPMHSGERYRTIGPLVIDLASSAASNTVSQANSSLGPLRECLISLMG